MCSLFPKSSRLRPKLAIFKLGKNEGKSEKWLLTDTEKDRSSRRTHLSSLHPTRQSHPWCQPQHPFQRHARVLHERDTRPATSPPQAVPCPCPLFDDGTLIAPPLLTD